MCVGEQSRGVEAQGRQAEHLRRPVRPFATRHACMCFLFLCADDLWMSRNPLALQQHSASTPSQHRRMTPLTRSMTACT